MREHTTCRSCGTRAEEWHESSGGRRDAYAAVVDLCPGCEKKETLEASLDKAQKVKGTFIRLVRTAEGGELP